MPIIRTPIQCTASKFPLSVINSGVFTPDAEDAILVGIVNNDDEVELATPIIELFRDGETEPYKTFTLAIEATYQERIHGGIWYVERVENVASFVRTTWERDVRSKAHCIIRLTGASKIYFADKQAGDTDKSGHPYSGLTATTSFPSEFIWGIIGHHGDPDRSPGSWVGLSEGQHAGTFGGSDFSNCTIWEAFGNTTVVGQFKAEKVGMANDWWTAMVATFEAEGETTVTDGSRSPTEIDLTYDTPPRTKYKGRDIPILSVRPDWKSVPTLTLLGGVIIREALALVEERHLTRPRPLYGLEYRTMPLDAAETGYMRKVLELAQDLPVGCPVWPMEVDLEVAATAGATSLAVESVEWRMFKICQLAIVWKDFDTWEVVRLLTVANELLTLYDPLVNSWAAKSKVIPLLFGKVPRPTFDMLTDEFGPHDIRFEETFHLLYDQTRKENDYVDDEMPTFLSRRILATEPDFKNVNAGQIDDFTYDQRGFGLATPWKKTTGPARKCELQFLNLTAKDNARTRAFMNYGRLRGFWLPIALNEFAIKQDESAGATSITVARTKLTEALNSFTQFGFIFLRTRRDKLECYTLSGVSISGDDEVLTLGEPLETDLVSRRTICGGLIWARFRDEALAFRHETRNVAKLNLGFVELPAEYDEASDGTAPVSLYECDIDGQHFRWSNWGVRVSAGSKLWVGRNMTNGSVRAGIDFLSEQLEMQIATDDQKHPLRPYLITNMLQLAEVKVYNVDYFAGGFDAAAPFYEGRLSKASFDESGKIDAPLSSIFRLNERRVPRKQYQRTCNHRLYDEFCAVDVTAFTTVGVIMDATATYIEATEFGDKATAQSDPDWFVFGQIRIGHELRVVTKQDGNKLYVNTAFTNVTLGQKASARAGCDKRVETCRDKFNNLANNVSFPYLPNQNPQFQDAFSTTGGGSKK